MKLFELLEKADESFDIKQAWTRGEKFALLGLEPVTEGARYQKVPGTQMSARFDSGNTNTLTQDHAHIFARPNGQGKELYSVNKSGTGHDGSSGQAISPKVASFLKSQGYRIPDNLVLESLDLSAVLEDRYVLIVLYG